jgi:predicted amidohydrolase
MPGRDSGVFFLTLFLGAALSAAENPAAPPRLNVAVAQTPNEATLAASRERMLAYIREAGLKRVRVVVFPEGALTGKAAKGSSEAAEMSATIATLQKAAAKNSVYVIFGAFTQYAPGWGTYPAMREKPFHWVMVIDPLGRPIYRYDKLHDVKDGPAPGLFEIDGIPSHAILGADRALRSVSELPVIEGARLSFELTNELEFEWTPGLDWHVSVARAMRNNAWVVYANSGNLIRPSTPDNGFRDSARHGHSAVIAPDGEVVASLDKREDLLITGLDVSRATRAGAAARRIQGAFGKWWQEGLLARGGLSRGPDALKPLESPEKEVTIAAAQIVLAHDPGAVFSAIKEAAAGGARLVAFPARTLRRDAAESLEPVRKAAQAAGIYVAIGAAGSAYVFSPAGEQLTRYSPGGDAKAMWFRVDGIPAIVTLGERDGLWTEVPELAAAAGAQIHVHLAHDMSSGEPAELERRQLGAAMASFGMLTAVVNAAAPSAAGHSAIWDDLNGIEEAKAAWQTRKIEKPELIWMYSPWSANLVTEAGSGEKILYVTRRVNRFNPYFAQRVAPFVASMKTWWENGARSILPDTTRQVASIK